MLESGGVAGALETSMAVTGLCALNDDRKDVRVRKHFRMG